MALLVGSTALQKHIPSLNRKPKDADWIVSPYDRYQYPGDTFSHVLLNGWVGDYYGGLNRIVTLDELYTLKVSHSYWEIGNTWGKHIYDIQLMKEHGATLIPDLHKTLYKVWEEKHGKKKTNLSMEKGSFFKDAVVRIYDHDSIHDSVAYGDKAMYESILKDGSTVDVDSGKMWALSHEDLVKLFREEVYATALERILIPTGYAYSPGAAYLWALRRTITSLTKGRSATFIVDNYREFAKPEADYLQRHLDNAHRLVKL